MRDQSDVELIREAFQRWNERDIEYWIRHAHPDVEIWSKYASLDEGGGPYRGHAGLREWRAEIDRRTQGSPEAQPSHSAGYMLAVRQAPRGDQEHLCHTITRGLISGSREAMPDSTSATCSPSTGRRTRTGRSSSWTYIRPRRLDPEGPTTAEPFSPEAIYELRIDTDGDLVANITYRFRFSPSENGAQSATVRRVEGADGAARRRGSDHRGCPGIERPRSAVTQAGEYRFFAGWRSDPFFFDAGGALNEFQFTGDDFFADVTCAASCWSFQMRVGRRRGRSLAPNAGPGR